MTQSRAKPSVSTQLLESQPAFTHPRYPRTAYNFMVLLVIKCITLLILNCTFDYTEASFDDSLDKDIPEIVATNVLLGFDRGKLVTLQAEELEVYSEKKEQEIKGLRFREESEDGRATIYGNADRATIESDSKNVILRGAIRVRSDKDEVDFEASFLQWIDKKKRIEGKASESFVLKRDDGSYIEGKGFSADGETRKMEFSNGLQGILVVEDKDDLKDGETTKKTSKRRGYVENE